MGEKEIAKEEQRTKFSEMMKEKGFTENHIKEAIEMNRIMDEIDDFITKLAVKHDLNDIEILGMLEHFRIRHVVRLIVNRNVLITEIKKEGRPAGIG